MKPDRVAPGRDPWEHRSHGMRCATCMFFVAKAVSRETAARRERDGDARGALGRCRLHGPTMRGFPGVFETDWCGDHKLDEERV